MSLCERVFDVIHNNGDAICQLSRVSCGAIVNGVLVVISLMG